MHIIWYCLGCIYVVFLHYKQFKKQSNELKCNMPNFEYED